MIGIFEFYEADSFLHRRNPAVKLLALLMVMLVVTPASDPVVPALFLPLILVALHVLGRVPLRLILRMLLPLTLLVFPFLLFNALYYNIGQVAAPTPWVRLGPWTLYREGVIVGLAVSLRVLVFISLSMSYITTTDPTDFALSLIQQAHIPYRFGYAILVSYRFLPLMVQEFSTIRAAHRVRGVGEHVGLRGRLEQVRRYTVPLLASAIRKSERTAIAMDARGFGSAGERTYYRQLRVTPGDWGLVAGTVLVSVGMVAVLYVLRLLHNYGPIPPA